MARARNIKPALFKNEVLGVADPLLTLLFEGLWVLADRSGRLEDRPLRIKAEVFPYRDGLSIDSMLNWLAANGFITRYKARGVRCIHICEFEKHQNPHKNESPSELPSVEEAECTEDSGASSEFIGSAPADPLNLIPDSLSTDSGSLIPDPVNTALDAQKRAKALSSSDLVSDGLTEQTAVEFLSLRKSKRAQLTPRAWDGIKREAVKAGWPIEQAVAKCLSRGWTAFEADWVKSGDRGRIQNGAARDDAAMQLLGFGHDHDVIEG